MIVHVILVYKFGFIEIASDGVDYEEHKGNDEYGQDDVYSSFPYIMSNDYLPSIIILLKFNYLHD